MATRARAQKPARVQVANFVFDQILTLNQENSTEFIAFNMASIPLSFVNTTAVENRLENMMKSIDVTGIVINHGYFNLGPWQAEALYDDVAESPVGVVRESLAQTMLISCRNDVDGLPIGLEFPWHTSNGPIAWLASSTQDDHDMPSRIHYRDAEYLNSSRLPAASSASTFVPSQQAIAARRQRRIRTKVKLDEEHGLFLLFALSVLGDTVNVATTNMNVKFWATGTMYYNYRM